MSSINETIVNAERGFRMVRPIKCGNCRHRMKSPTLRCTTCRYYYHYRCQHLEKKHKELIENFICEECEAKFNIATTWTGKTPVGEDKTFKEQNYFEVKKILAWRNNRKNEIKGRYFLVKWEGEDSKGNSYQDSWEPEKYLDGCVDILNMFCRKKRIPITTIEKLVGASQNAKKTNENNWVSIKEIISMTEKLRKANGYDIRCKMEEFEILKKEDRCYFINLNNHCFVALYLANSCTTYIADGGNQYYNYKQKFQEMFGGDVKYLNYAQQSKVDYCGSSAVLIALCMLRYYKNNNWRNEIYSTPSERKKVTGYFHKEYSEKLDKNKKIVSYKTKIPCKICSKSCKAKSITLHELFCSKS